MLTNTFRFAFPHNATRTCKYATEVLIHFKLAFLREKKIFFLWLNFFSSCCIISLFSATVPWLFHELLLLGITMIFKLHRLMLSVLRIHREISFKIIFVAGVSISQNSSKINSSSNYIKWQTQAFYPALEWIC